jgi:serine/threonine protein kinase
VRFEKNQRISAGGKDYVILDLLGEGGQGEVYLAECSGKRYALKVYKDFPHPDFCYNLKSNVEKGSPSESFLWPHAIVQNDDTFGYLMDLRPKNYVSFVSYLTGKNKFLNQSTLLNWCIKLCLSFKKLHEMGYSYQDLNDGSFFFDPDTGDLLICDNDNVTADKKNLGILGKMRYMAPEIVRGAIDPRTKERQMPDVHSDRFSLAVILFMTLCLGNPYEGERLKDYVIIDEEAELELYGKNPLFVYHKTDKSNRPIRGYHSSVLKRWPLLPLYVKEAFHRTFVDGLRDRENERTTELEWLRLLTKYRDELLSCSCGYQYAYGLFDKSEREECPLCKTKRAEQYTFLTVGKSKILLEPGKKLYAPHLDKYSSSYNDEVGEVIRNKNNPALWGIRIKLGHSVLIKDENGNEKTVAAGGVIPIVKGLKINFNENTIGEIK